jgi:NADPH:quinone reductase-like Zn-dependent oxidoreductase
LIYGASSSVGLFAVQFAKILGYKTVAVCSPHNFDLVKSYGADEVVDYHNEEEAIAQIKKITNGVVKIGMDTISEGKSFEISCKSFAEGGGRLNAILWPTDEQRIRKDVEIETTLMYTFFGKVSLRDLHTQSMEWLAHLQAFTSLGRDWPAVPEDEAFGADAYARSADMIKKYNIRANPIDHRNGLDAIVDGLEHMKQGKVSGKKLIYKIAQ